MAGDVGYGGLASSSDTRASLWQKMRKVSLTDETFRTVWTDGSDGANGANGSVRSDWKDRKTGSDRDRAGGRKRFAIGARGAIVVRPADKFPLQTFRGFAAPVA